MKIDFSRIAEDGIVGVKGFVNGAIQQATSPFTLAMVGGIGGISVFKKNSTEDTCKAMVTYYVRACVMGGVANAISKIGFHELTRNEEATETEEQSGEVIDAEIVKDEE